MKNYRIEYHKDVLMETAEVYHWYEVRKEGLGEQFLENVYKTINQVLSYPEAWSVKSRKGFRETKVKRFPYVVVYRLYKKKRLIFVSSIHHEKRSNKNRYRKM